MIFATINNRNVQQRKRIFIDDDTIGDLHIRLLADSRKIIKNSLIEILQEVFT